VADRALYQLRPLHIEDKAMVLSWRNQERVRRFMYTDHVISTDEHERWLSQALANTSARYLIFEFNSRPVGFVSFSNLEPIQLRGSWAYYLGETDVPNGTGSAMEFLALDYAFEHLKIRKLCCEVFGFNESVIKLHQKFGFRQEGLFAAHVLKSRVFEDVVVLAIFASDWMKHRERMAKVCFR